MVRCKALGGGTVRDENKGKDGKRQGKKLGGKSSEEGGGRKE